MGDLKDLIMEESDAEGETAGSSSSLTSVDPVVNMIVIPVPAPSVVHTLVPVEFPLEFVPLILQSKSTPSPPYIEACEEDPTHDGVPEYWANVE